MKKDLSVAILLNDHSRSEKVGEELRNRGNVVVVIKGMDELYDRAGVETFDVLVIEQKLRGFLTGLEVLARLHQQLVRPVTILLAEERSQLGGQAKKLGVLNLLPPTATVDTLLAAVEAASTASSQSQINSCPLAKRIVSQAELVEPLPQLLIRLSQLLREGDASPEKVHREIAIDPRATVDVLRIANSSALGRNSRTSSVLEAINFIGVRRTISLILSAGVARAQGGLMRDLLPQTRLWYGHRSVLIANVAKAFAQRMEDISPDTAYVLGLLQDTGILLLAHTYGTRYHELLQRVKEIPHLRLFAEEQREFGTTHAMVTSALLEQWELPQALAMIVADHHRSDTTVLRSETDRAFARVMQIGEAAADFFVCRSPQRFIMLRQLLSHYGVHNSEMCRTCLEESVQEVLESSQILSLPMPDDIALSKMISDIHEFAIAEDEADPHRAAAPAQATATAPADGIEPAEDMLLGDPSAKASADEVLEDSTPKRAPRARILVIEDEYAIVKGIRSLLASCDVEVLHATGTAEALRYAERVSAILSDVHLGEEDGIDVLIDVRASGYTGPVIMISGDSLRTTVTRSAEVGITGYLVKPFSRKLLLEKLSQCTGLKFLRESQNSRTANRLSDSPPEHPIEVRT